MKKQKERMKTLRHLIKSVTIERKSLLRIQREYKLELIELKRIVLEEKK